MNNVPTMSFRAYCLDCKTFHDIRTEPGTSLIREMESWEYKHRGHRIEMSSKDRKIPKNFDDSEYDEAPWWLDPAKFGLKENTNFQISYVASANLTFTSIASLGTSSSLLAGANATAIDNGATGAPMEIGVTALVKNGSSSPSAGTSIQIYAAAPIDDTPTWPDTITGSDGAITLTTAAIQNSGLVLMSSLAVAATANQVNPMRPTALGAMFGWLPRKWTIFVTQNTGVSLASSGHQFTYKGLYVQG